MCADTDHGLPAKYLPSRAVLKLAQGPSTYYSMVLARCYPQADLAMDLAQTCLSLMAHVTTSMC